MMELYRQNKAIILHLYLLLFLQLYLLHCITFSFQRTLRSLNLALHIIIARIVIVY